MNDKNWIKQIRSRVTSLLLLDKLKINIDANEVGNIASDEEILVHLLTCEKEEYIAYKKDWDFE